MIFNKTIKLTTLALILGSSLCHTISSHVNPVDPANQIAQATDVPGILLEPGDFDQQMQHLQNQLDALVPPANIGPAPLAEIAEIMAQPLPVQAAAAIAIAQAINPGFAPQVVPPIENQLAGLDAAPQLLVFQNLLDQAEAQLQQAVMQLAEGNAQLAQENAQLAAENAQIQAQADAEQALQLNQQLLNQRAEEQTSFWQRCKNRWSNLNPYIKYGVIGAATLATVYGIKRLFNDQNQE